MNSSKHESADEILLRKEGSGKSALRDLFGSQTQSINVNEYCYKIVTNTHRYNEKLKTLAKKPH